MSGAGDLSADAGRTSDVVEDEGTLLDEGAGVVAGRVLGGSGGEGLNTDGFDLGRGK